VLLLYRSQPDSTEPAAPDNERGKTMLNIQVGGYTQISKKEAHKLFNDAGTVYLCAANLRPGAPWYPEVAISISQTDLNFNEKCTAFQYYNRTSKSQMQIRYYKLA
jgi:hypothetical protein